MFRPFDQIQQKSHKTDLEDVPTDLHIYNGVSPSPDSRKHLRQA